MQTTTRNAEQRARGEATRNARGAPRPNAEVLAELEAEWIVDFDARKALRIIRCFTGFNVCVRGGGVCHRVEKKNLSSDHF